MKQILFVLMVGMLLSGCATKEPQTVTGVDENGTIVQYTVRQRGILSKNILETVGNVLLKTHEATKALR